METSLYRSIWQVCKIAFAITNRELVILEMGGPPDILDVDGSVTPGRSLFELFPELLGSEQDFEDLLEGKLDSLRLEYINRETTNGNIRYLTMEDLPYRDPNGNITGILHIVQDVTNKGELGQQVTQNRNELQLLKGQIEHQNLDLTAANAELRRLSELKSQFISTAAHELRTPLTTLTGYIEMLMDCEWGPLTEKQQEVLEIIQSSGLRLVRLTDQLLNSARLETGRIDLVLRPEDLTGLVQEVISENAVQVQTRGQVLSFEAEPGLPLALCDRNWARQIVSNLLSNASKFTPVGGQIIVRVAMAEQPGFLELSVADTGVGIPKQDQEKVFSRWFRAKNASAVNTRGSGLGLYITHSLVELHNGSIWMESEPDKGSVFYVTFPVAG